MHQQSARVAEALSSKMLSWISVQRDYVITSCVDFVVVILILFFFVFGIFC